MWAAHVLDWEEAGHELPGQDGCPTMHGYSPVVSRLDLIADRVMAVRTAVQANYSKDHVEPKFDPITRPETALDRERERRARNLLLEVDALVMGGGMEIDILE